MDYVITNKGIFFYNDKEVWHSSIVIEEETMGRMPFRTKNLFDYYKRYVVDFTKLPTNKKKIDEKYLNNLIKRFKNGK